MVFEPGPDAIKAMFALQIEVTLIFLILGITGWGSKLVNVIPNSLKAGIIIGAGIAAMMGELKVGRPDRCHACFFDCWLNYLCLCAVFAIFQKRN